MAREAARKAAAAAPATPVRKYSWVSKEVEGDPLAMLNQSLTDPPSNQPPQLRRTSTTSSGWDSLMAGSGQPVAAAGGGGAPPPGFWPPFPAMSGEDATLWRQRWEMAQDPMALDSEPPAKASRVDGEFRITDDGHMELGGMALRMSLRPPNVPASRWWCDDTLGVSTVQQEPVRGSSLYTGDITGTKTLNPTTIKKLHNRKSRMTHKVSTHDHYASLPSLTLLILQALLVKNNGSIPMGSSFFLDRVEGDNRSALTANPEAGFKSADNLKELEEGLHLWSAAIHGIRAWSFEAHALLFCMSEISYFMACAPSPKVALDMSTKVVDKVLSKNTCRAREGGPPLTSKEIFEYCKEQALDAGLPDHGLKKVPTYLTKSGSSNKRPSEEDSTSPKRTSRRDNSSTGSKDFNADGLTLKQRMALVCNNFNTGNCNRKACSRAHACSYPMPDGKLCGQKHALVESH